MRFPVVPAALQKCAHVLHDYAVIVREALSQDPVRAPEIVGKVLDARLRYDFGPVDFFLNDLINRPRSTWRDYLREQPHNAEMLRILHPADASIIARDKVLAAERCQANAIPIVPIVAVVGRQPEHRCAGAFPLLGSVEEAMRAMPNWPDDLFVKPVSGAFGQDVMALSRSAQGWRNGRTLMTDAELASRLLSFDDPTGALVQPRIANDPSMAAVSGGTGLCATRIITALTADGPEIFVAVHKVLATDGIADNFSGGVTGNLLCVVDRDSGRLGIAYGRHKGHRFLLTRHTHHPQTGQRFRDFTLPHWSAVRDVALRTASVFPALPLLGHDIAITADGPLFLETNTHWRIMLPQLALGGLRPALHALIPRLAIAEETKRAALAALGQPLPGGAAAR
jgi:hypothetical protein